MSIIISQLQFSISIFFVSIFVMINFIQILIKNKIAINKNVHLNFLLFMQIWNPKKWAWLKNLKISSLHFPPKVSDT
jgi:hypothetical protein